MTEREIEAYCINNGIPFKRQVVGGVETLRVMETTQLPMPMREACDERGFVKADPIQAPAEVEEVKPSPLRGKLPADFPGHAALEAEGLTTYAKVRKRLSDLTSIPGIGEATAEKITAAMGESSADEEEQEQTNEDARSSEETSGS